MQENLINYGFLNDAIKMYERYGYHRISVPWLVSGEAIYATKPRENKSFETFDGHLVGSGEQGFIQMAMDGQLKHDTRLMTVTPCFRDDRPDEWHFRQFMKVELCWAYPKKDSHLDCMLNAVITDAQFVFRYLGAKTTIVESAPGVLDLVDERGVELGSYGFRTLGGFSWVFGTGIAEPRFSQAAKARFDARYGGAIDASNS